MPRMPRLNQVGPTLTDPRRGRWLAAVVLLRSAIAFAQPAEGGAVPEDEPGEAAAPVSLELGLDVTTAYFYHGFNQEDCGFIVQPSASLTFRLFESEDVLIEGTVGTWSSLHSQKTGAASRSDLGEWWYEADVSGGLSLSAGPFCLSATYCVFASPSDAFATLQELDLSLALDDSELLGEWAFQPFVLIGIETDGQAADGDELGVYGEMGVAPGLTFEVAGTEMEVAFPLTVGVSLRKYYQDDGGEDQFFGHASAGATASVPLGDSGCVATAGISVLLLGDHAAAANDGDDAQVVGTLGLRWTF
ncbi:MAG: hypothetical protein DYG92_05160 [Leptolyngbya sp. PLA1]|nr:hypothetical protein [Leptolyngbya sp. PLA1]